MTHTLIQIQSYLFIKSQPKVSFQFLIFTESSTWYLLLHTIIFIQSHILRLQMGSTTFNIVDSRIVLVLHVESNVVTPLIIQLTIFRYHSHYF